MPGDVRRGDGDGRGADNSDARLGAPGVREDVLAHDHGGVLLRGLECPADGVRRTGLQLSRHRRGGVPHARGPPIPVIPVADGGESGGDVSEEDGLVPCGQPADEAGDYLPGASGGPGGGVLCRKMHIIPLRQAQRLFGRGGIRHRVRGNDILRRVRLRLPPRTLQPRAALRLLRRHPAHRRRATHPLHAHGRRVAGPGAAGFETDV
mmetsp:Transcript_17607/g.39493  ORF Transcript_17607/g.39493 Transcript_17607/m.39493 type:complete len:207 (+) Transcript_17607:744-1364(+)